MREKSVFIIYVCFLKMSGMGYSREAVRVKVKKCEGSLPPETRKFSVDPQITSLEVLYSILAKAFDLKTDFGISYKTLDFSGTETYLVVLSDWDLDAAFLRAHNLSIATASEPCLNLKIDIKPFSEAPDWDITAATITRESSIQQSFGAGHKYVQNKLPGLIINQMEKTFSLVQRALNLVEDPLITQLPRSPLSDSEFREYCDSVGQIVHANELRNVIFLGGIEPSLRRVIWKHILNVYPGNMTGRDRMDYMKKKSAEYYKLREIWRNAVQKGNLAGELAYVTSMVRKDVLRTDRLHPFYAGSDDNQNIAALFNILTTYALNHPAVSYCQGMSDIASPILFIMKDEAQAYICFCAVMRRLSVNFMLDGIAMTAKFAHLADALQHYDPEFYDYLKQHQADDLLFCYRWLLLEMKREFAFEDSLRMLEVLWSSLPPSSPELELPLFEKEFVYIQPEMPAPKSPSAVVMRTPRENAYTKICALRRQSSALSLLSGTPNHGIGNKLDSTKRLNLSLDENINRNRNKDLSMRKTHQSLDETKIMLIKQKYNLDISSNEDMKLNIDADADEVGTIAVKPMERYPEITGSTETNPFLSDSTKNIIVECHTEMERIIEKPPINSVTSSGGGGHFRELKNKIANSKKNILASLDKIELDEKQPKLIKNFNEFLNFSSRTSTEKSTPVHKFKKLQNDDNSDSSSNITDTTFNNQSSTTTLDENSPDDSQEYYPMTTSITRELRLELENLDRHVFGEFSHQAPQSYFEPLTEELEDTEKDKMFFRKMQQQHQIDTINTIESVKETDEQVSNANKKKMDKQKRISVNNEVFVWENPLHQFETGHNQLALEVNIDGIENNRSNVQNEINLINQMNFVHQTTPDEQAELEYDGDIIIESNENDENGQNNVKPIIRLLLKNENKSNRNSVILNVIDTDSENSNGEKNTQYFNPNNPFYEQIKQLEMKTSSTSGDEVVGTPSASVPSSVTDDKIMTTSMNIEMTKIAGILPPPNEFGGGNPFLMFLCLTLLLQHRDYIMKTGMDYNEMAMHFDKMVRKHNVVRVLNQARRMYTEYKKLHDKDKNSKSAKEYVA